MDFGSFSPWYLLTGTALIGVLAGFWSKIKAVLWRIMNLFVQQVEIHTVEGHNAVVAYLIANYKRSRTYDKMYGASYEYQRDGKYAMVGYEQYGNRTLVFWRGWFPFLYSNAIESKANSGKNGANNNNNNDDITKVYSTITFIRGTIDVEAIIKDACVDTNNQSWRAAGENEKNKNRFVIHYVPKREDNDHRRDYSSNGLAWYQQRYYRLLTHMPEQLGKVSLHRGRALENLIFPKRIKDLIQEIELWRKSRDWYIEKGIPWKRGWLLYGPPGTGKTALARAFAEDLNMPIYVFNLAEMSNHDLIKTWTEMQVNVPCIALIEDIDNVFHGRENVARRNSFSGLIFRNNNSGNSNNNNDRKDNDGMGNPFTPLTFDCLLNCLDGVERADGIFTIISTNDISKIDPALGQPRKLPDGGLEFISTRPGRIDKAVELSYMEAGDKKLMAKRILGEYLEPYEKMLAFIDQYPTLQETPAQFQERCGQIALACFWREQHPEWVDANMSMETAPPPSEALMKKLDAPPPTGEASITPSELAGS